MTSIANGDCVVRVVAPRQIELTWCDGESARFHFVWLRQQHFHPAIGRPDLLCGRALRLPDEPESLRVGSARIEHEHLIVDWANDGARTCHELGWLRSNAYDEHLRLARKPILAPWVGAQAAQFPWHSWDEVMTNEEALWELFATVRDRGLIRLSGAPVAEGVISNLAGRFGTLRSTDFGSVSDIMSRPTAEAGRFANIGAGGFHQLAPHTDEGWRYAPPGLAFHLCLEQAPGGHGASMLCDGFLAAERLRQNDLESFDFLTRTPLRFAAARNPDERYFANGRLIVTDLDGDIIGVRFSDRTLGVQNLPSDLIEPAYHALRAFTKELYSEDLIYEHALAPGEMHIFDNHRVLHARASFDPEVGPRRLQSCSVDREEFHNQLRQLAEKLGHQEDANMTLPNGALG